MEARMSGETRLRLGYLVSVVIVADQTTFTAELGGQANGERR